MVSIQWKLYLWRLNKWYRWHCHFYYFVLFYTINITIILGAIVKFCFEIWYVKLQPWPSSRLQKQWAGPGPESILTIPIPLIHYESQRAHRSLLRWLWILDQVYIANKITIDTTGEIQLRYIACPNIMWELSDVVPAPISIPSNSSGILDLFISEGSVWV